MCCDFVFIDHSICFQISNSCLSFHSIIHITFVRFITPRSSDNINYFCYFAICFCAIVDCSRWNSFGGSESFWNGSVHPVDDLLVVADERSSGNNGLICRGQPHGGCSICKPTLNQRQSVSSFGEVGNGLPSSFLLAAMNITLLDGQLARMIGHICLDKTRMNRVNDQFLARILRELTLLNACHGADAHFGNDVAIIRPDVFTLPGFTLWPALLVVITLFDGTRSRILAN